MKPVLICRYAASEGPGYFATYLSAREIPWRVVKIDEGEGLPVDAAACSGLALMGGPMSVNDPLPWIPGMLEYIRACVGADVPVLGHCLGGQLMSRALGGTVTRNPVKEIGWAPVEVLDRAAAERLGASSFLSFHWHGETFSIPDGATRVFASAQCANQGFVLGKHLGLQCHVEMTEALVEAWCASGVREIERNRGRSPAVQSVAEIRTDLAARLAALHGVADRLYGEWVKGLAAA
jgi:GMP synthase-like glutamine amidotransferase